MPQKNSYANANESDKIISSNGLDREVDMKRRKFNLGVFEHLQIPMQKKSIVSVCKKYGVDISVLKIKIQRDEGLLNAFFAGTTAYEDVGRIDLTPNAFKNEEELLKTIIHERIHVKQLLKYGKDYVQAHRNYMEKVAERGEEFFYRIVKRRVKR